MYGAIEVSQRIEDPCSGAGVAQRLGGHLLGPMPSRVVADQQRG